MESDHNPYYIAYACLPVAAIEHMVHAQYLIDQAVAAGHHKQIEGELRKQALKTALEQAKRRDWSRRAKPVGRERF